MTSWLGAQAVSEHSSSVLNSRPRSWIEQALSLLALALMFWGFSRLDLPVIRFIRSLHTSGGIPTHPWLALWSDWGDWLGKGDVLFLFSALLLISGWLLNRSSLRWAGLESAVAHAVAGLLGLALKFLVGRPRPKYMHGDEWVMSPSLESGMHSFPSGHSYASFAVAVVLAKHFPRLGWLVYGLAALIMISRVIRGAHYPSDVAVGMVFGLLVAAFICNPAGNRWESTTEMLWKATVGVGVFFTFVWVATHIPSPEVWATLLQYVGLVLVVVGVSFRIWSPGRWGHHWNIRLRHVGTGLIGWGLAIFTSSSLVILVGTLLLIIHLLRGMETLLPKSEVPDFSRHSGGRLAAEGLVAIGAVGTLLVLKGLAGIIPFV